MHHNTKSSITLPVGEVAVVRRLKKRLNMKTNVEVVRAGLRLLEEQTERAALRAAYRDAAAAVRDTTQAEVAELDFLSGEGIA